MQTIVARVDVDTQIDGTTLVHWELDGDPVAVDVATGSTPDPLGHAPEASVPAGRTSVRIPQRPQERLYVSVVPHDGGRPTVAADRRVPFRKARNFRDLGGYRTRAGGSIRWGLVFRADGLHRLSDTDLDRYDRLGLRVVYDLRNDQERSDRPNPMPSRALTILGRAAGAAPQGATVSEPTGAVEGKQFLLDLYLGVLDHAAQQIGELFTGLAHDDGLPAVFHCHAGKDRTGVMAALLLEVLGVDRDTVLDDYELTARYRQHENDDTSVRRLVDLGMAPETAAGVITAPRWTMERTLDELDRRHGGAESYLTGPAGVSAGDLQTVRDRLVDRASDVSRPR